MAPFGFKDNRAGPGRKCRLGAELSGSRAGGNKCRPHRRFQQGNAAFALEQRGRPTSIKRRDVRESARSARADPSAGCGNWRGSHTCRSSLDTRSERWRMSPDLPTASGRRVPSRSPRTRTVSPQQESQSLPVSEGEWCAKPSRQKPQVRVKPDRRTAGEKNRLRERSAGTATRPRTRSRVLTSLEQVQAARRADAPSSADACAIPG